MPGNKGEILLPIARASIAGVFGQSHEAAEDAAWLQEQAACFVTLTQQGQLRGCIGTIEAHRSLLEDVTSNAKAAAFKDTRFSPLASNELSETEIEVSLLSAMQALDFSNEKEALLQLRPGIDGVVFEYAHYRSTFLPQVWEQLPDVDVFMEHLKHKAGLTPDFWADQVKLFRYTVSKWKERDLIKQEI
ncbi:MAG: AmmeMemoRadiSam system protein A [Gammaproteobacteria bacterium]